MLRIHPKNFKVWVGKFLSAPGVYISVHEDRGQKFDALHSLKDEGILARILHYTHII